MLLLSMPFKVKEIRVIWPALLARSSQTRGCLAAKPTSILVEEHRGGYESQGQEAKESVAPTVVERLIHLCACQRKESTE